MTAADRQARARRLLVVLQAAGMVGVLLLLVSIPAISVYQTWQAQQTLKAAANVGGAPCPRIADASGQIFRPRSPMTFRYEGVKFERRFGNVTCAAPFEDGFMNPQIYRVCQFTSPDIVRVTTGDQSVAFRSGVGHSATVKLRHGQISCVMGRGSRL